MTTRPLHVLHVIGSLGVGGAETWIMELLRESPSSAVKYSILVHRCVDSRFAREVESLGVEVYSIQGHRRPWQYIRKLYRLLAVTVRPDVVHSHVHFFSGTVLSVARAAGVPGRVATSHNDTSEADSSAPLWRKAYLHLQAALLRRATTEGTAVSQRAGRCLYGEEWGHDPRFSIAYCGINVAAVTSLPYEPALRQSLGIRPEVPVLGLVGRLDPVKNHERALMVLRTIKKLAPDVVLVIAGGGQLDSQLKKLADDLGLTASVLFLGVRDDVAALMVSVFDCLLMPSHHEGLPVVLMESQAAGLPVVASDVVADDLDVPGGRVARVALAASDEVWAKAVVQELQAPRRRPTTTEALRWPFAIQTSVAAILAVYRKSVVASR